LSGARLAIVRNKRRGTLTIDLGPAAIAFDGTYSFAVAASAASAVIFSSREGTQQPQLIVTATAAR
jgi:hypothetical protein